jgi:hypothetical protein
MKQIVQRWAGIGLMAASVLTVGGMLMLQSGKPLASSAGFQLTGTTAVIQMEPMVLMADGGGDAPVRCSPKKPCWSGEATL